MLRFAGIVTSLIGQLSMRDSILSINRKAEKDLLGYYRHFNQVVPYSFLKGRFDFSLSVVCFKIAKLAKEVINH